VSGIECCSTRDSSLCLVVDGYSINYVLRKVEVALFLYRQVVRVQMKGGFSLCCVDSSVLTFVLDSIVRQLRALEVTRIGA
jgi:hypothetical protein